MSGVGLTINEIRDAIDKVSAKLSTKHKRFADEYLVNGRKGTAAYIAVFKSKSSKTAANGAYRILKRPDVKAYVDLCRSYTTEETLNHLACNKERVLDEEAKLAYFDFRSMFDDNGEIIHPKDWPEEMARAVAGVDIDQSWDEKNSRWKYKYRIKWNDKGRSLKRLQDCLGMTKQPELSDKDTDLFKDFLTAIDGDSRGTLPSEVDD